MTEFWRSNPNHWCELCKCWMTDTKAARLNHERGMGHQENLKRKLRDMGKKADADKRNAAATEKAIGDVEASAAKQYAKDVAERRAALGTWDWDDGAQYYYNAVQRWYFDPKTSWYYGGEPIAWTQSPASLPADARFGVADHVGGPIEQGAKGVQPAAAAPSSSSRPGASSGPITTTKVQRVIHLPKHPMQDIGGHAMPSAGGRIGAAKGVGAAPSTSEAGGAGGAGGGQGATAAGKRGRDGAAGGKAVSAEEAAALARREAARQRVSARTMTTYGLS